MADTGYTVIRSFDKDEFEAAVNKALTEGKRLAGGVSVVSTGTKYDIYAQAVVDA